MELLAVEEAEIVGLGANLVGYRLARGAGYSHGELVEIARLGVRLDDYWWGRVGGCGHVELVEVIGMGVRLDDYWWARTAGVAHEAIVGAVTVHGLPAGLFNRFLERIAAAPDVDVATVVFELVADVT